MSEPGGAAADSGGTLRWMLPTTTEAARAIFVGVVGTAASFAYAGPTTDFVAAPVHGWVVDLTPAPILAAAIQGLGQGSEVLAFLVALVATVGLLSLASLAATRIGDRFAEPAATVLATYFVSWGTVALVLRAPFPALPPALSMVVAAAALRRVGVPVDDEPGRRAVLKAAVATIGVVGLSTAIGLQRSSATGSPLGAISTADREVIERKIEAARARSLDIEGLHDYVSPIDEFYEVDVNAIDPDLTVDDWRLRVTGAVEETLSLDYGELTSLPREDRFDTLRCVGEPLNGRLMDTALWTGVPVGAILERARPSSECGCVMLRAGDGYYEEFPLPALTRGLLAFGMNGRLLPREHGFPLRALVPGHWGEVNVKWLTEIEVLEREGIGYWERRGWHGTGPVTTVAKIHAENRLEDGRLQVAGHAYAGLRGIERVEVSVDGGETWGTARLSGPLPDPDTWREWAFEWEPTAEVHEVVVRAVDGEGVPQPREETSPFPSGASGWVSRTIRA